MADRSRSLVDFLHAPVLVGDADGRVVYVNPAFETDFLVPLDQIAGQPLASLFSGGGRESVLRAVARLCGAEGDGDAQRFVLRVEDRGYRALASAVEVEEGRVGVILLLFPETAGELRVHNFQREVEASLDELSACLARLAEHASGPNAQVQRIAIADAVLCAERIRKFAEAVAAGAKG